MSPESITMRVLPPEADTRKTISISAAKVKENFGVLRRNERENRFDASMSAVFYTVARDHHHARKEESTAQLEAVSDPTLP